MEVVWVAVIVGGFAVVQTLLTGHQRRADKKQDYERQDAVAAAAAAAVAATSMQLGVIVKGNEDIVKGNAVIHGLVNSTLTASKQAELTARELYVGELEKNTPPDDIEGIAKLEEARAAILTLRQELFDRETATAATDFLGVTAEVDPG